MSRSSGSHLTYRRARHHRAVPPTARSTGAKYQNSQTFSDPPSFQSCFLYSTHYASRGTDC